MVAARFALTWVRVYTRGMPDTERRARVDELRSDVWEHLDHAVAAGRRRSIVQFEIAGRTTRGVAADLGWRYAHRTSPPALTAARWAGWGAFATGSALLLALTAGSGAPVLGLYSIDDWPPGDAREYARVMAALFILLTAGLALISFRPRAGLALIVAACVALSAYLYCLWAIVVPAGLACIAGAGLVARRHTRRIQRPV
jgi:hypothetical protein